MIYYKDKYNKLYIVINYIARHVGKNLENNCILDVKDIMSILHT